MKVSKTSAKDCQIIALQGRLDAQCRDAVNAELAHIDRLQNADRLIVDLSGVDVIDSSGLTVLLSVYRRSCEANRDLGLCGLNAPVRRVIELTRLHRIFEIYATREDAIRGIGHVA
ncbi:MAG: STAS domain-containing protein [Pseudomonadota bacterium]